DPMRLLGGSIEAPAFNLRNPLMVAKHIRSAILSELLLRSTDPGATGEKARQVLDLLWPTFIRSYLLDEDNQFRETPTSTEPLWPLLSTMRESLADRLVALFAHHWPEDAAELSDRTSIVQVIDGTADDLDVVINRLHRRLTWARKTRSDLYTKK